MPSEPSVLLARVLLGAVDGQWTQPPEFLMQSSYRVTARQQGQQDDSQQQQAQEVRGWQVRRLIHDVPGTTYHRGRRTEGNAAGG